MYKIFIVCISLVFTSCLEDLDFDQAEDLELSPTEVVSLLNFNLNQVDLIGANILVITDELTDGTILPSFKNALFEEHLETVGLEFQLSNSFDEEFTFQVTFFDENDVEVYAVKPIVVEGNTEMYTYMEDIMLLNNPDFINSHRIEVTLSYAGTTIDVNEESSLVFKSAGTFYF